MSDKFETVMYESDLICVDLRLNEIELLIKAIEIASTKILTEKYESNAMVIELDRIDDWLRYKYQEHVKVGAKK